MMFRSALETLLAITTSFSSVYLLFTGSWEEFLAAHCMACLLCFSTLVVWLRVHNNKQKGLLLLTMISVFFIPGFAIFGLPAAMVYGRSPPQAKKTDLTMTVKSPELPLKPLQFDSTMSFARGGLFEVLERSTDPDKRLTAVMATNRMRPQMAIPLLKIAMRDAVDDVRLLAYSIKDKHESEINEQIKGLTEGLKRFEREEAAAARFAARTVTESDTDTDAQVAVDAEPVAVTAAEPEGSISLVKASSLRSLAFAYWELAYLELAEGQIRSFCITQAAENAQRALSILRDAPTAVLLCRANLAAGNTKAADTALDVALEYGIAPNVVAPYRAEIAFAEGRYNDVATALQVLDEIKLESLQRVHEYWCSSKNQRGEAA